MIVSRSLAAVPSGLAPAAVTIGKFDGLHLGHRAVLARLHELAGDDLVPTVVTFDRNPLALLRPDRAPRPLTDLDGRLELLAGAGVGHVLVLTFDEALAALPAARFIDDVLVRALRARAVLVGADFRFGAGGLGDVALLQDAAMAAGFAVELLPTVAPDGERVSSSVVRGLLAAGDVEGAARLLGRPPTVHGLVVPGARRGREIGFPTANLDPAAAGFIPADGIYAGWLVDAGERLPAAISVGNNPTFEGVPQQQVEAHVIDRTLDLYGHRVVVEFTHRLRGQVAYRGVEALVEQIAADVVDCRRLLGLPPAARARPTR